MTTALLFTMVSLCAGCEDSFFGDFVLLEVDRVLLWATVVGYTYYAVVEVLYKVYDEDWRPIGWAFALVQETWPPGATRR